MVDETSHPAPTASEEKAVSVDQKPSATKNTILIVEDELSASKFLSLRLQRLGFEVLTAFDGLTGLSEAVTKIPSLVILDLMIPKLPGEEVCKSIRENLNEKIAGIPIIMLTGKDTLVDKVLGKVIGANAYLTKPYEFDDLLKEIKKIIALPLDP